MGVPIRNPVKSVLLKPDSILIFDAVDEAPGEAPVKGQMLAPLATEGVMHR